MYLRARQGLSDSLTEVSWTLALTWTTVSPFVIFQSLLCARDQGHAGRWKHDNGLSVTATEAVSPLLLLLGLAAVLLSVAMGFCYRTKGETDRRDFHEGRLGMRPIYKV